MTKSMLPPRPRGLLPGLMATLALGALSHPGASATPGTSAEAAPKAQAGPVPPARARPRPGPPLRSPAPIARLGRASLTRALARQARRPLARRVDFWSSLFLGTPYYVAPEGSLQAAAPSHGVAGLEVRWVDCESFVEQVLALAISTRPGEVPGHLRSVRYDSGIPGPTRRHFTVVKGWLAKNEAAGHLRDITRRLGGAATRQLVKDLTPTAQWRPWYLQRFMAQGVRAPFGKARIDYIPFASALAARGRLLRRIPSGAVIHLVSAPHPRSPYLVTHVGFVIQTPWGPVLRHASRSPHRRRVEDRPLGPYLHFVGRTPAGPEMRTAMGLHLSEVTAPKPTAAPGRAATAPPAPRARRR